MELGKTIRERRKALGLTQEQLADCLGVSAPAVHKWEKGVTCPDITTLPALARVLQTDLNTLLSFQEDLTDEEITRFVANLKRILETQGYDAAFQCAMDQIHQYPNCEKLIYATVFYLDGALALYAVPAPDGYKAQLMPFYERLSHSETPAVRDAALTVCIAYHRAQGAFDRAAALIDALPSPGIDKEEQLAVLYTQQEKHQEASRLWEGQILRSTVRIQTALANLMEIALRENRAEDARLLAEVSEQISVSLSVNRWVPYVTQLQLATRLRDRAGCLEALQKILPALEQPWVPGGKTLFRTVNGSSDSVAAIARQLRSRLLHDLEHDAEFDFFRNSQEYEQLRPLLAQDHA